MLKWITLQLTARVKAQQLKYKKVLKAWRWTKQSFFWNDWQISPTFWFHEKIFVFAQTNWWTDRSNTYYWKQKSHWQVESHQREAKQMNKYFWLLCLNCLLLVNLPVFGSNTRHEHSYARTHTQTHLQHFFSLPMIPFCCQLSNHDVCSFITLIPSCQTGLFTNT